MRHTIQRQQPKKNSAHILKPSVPGVFHENYRAELVGIHASIVHHSNQKNIHMYALHIYTDSLASIQAVESAIFHPHKHKRKLHADLVGDVAKLIIYRAKLTQHTHLHKVKSHSDLDGNSMLTRPRRNPRSLP